MKTFWEKSLKYIWIKGNANQVNVFRKFNHICSVSQVMSKQYKVLMGQLLEIMQHTFENNEGTENMEKSKMLHPMSVS